MTKKVVIVDDERAPLEYHIEALESAGYEVAFQKLSTVALQWPSNPGFKCDLAVVDMMMPPPPNASKAEFGLGEFTGAMVVREIRKHRDALPVLVLTNHTEPEVQDVLWDEFSKYCSDRGKLVPPFPDKREGLAEDFRVWFRTKRNTPPFVLLGIVQQILGSPS
jgi:CheY-like chemotaxis protein